MTPMNPSWSSQQARATVASLPSPFTPKIEISPSTIEALYKEGKAKTACNVVELPIGKEYNSPIYADPSWKYLGADKTPLPIGRQRGRTE